MYIMLIQILGQIYLLDTFLYGSKSKDGVDVGCILIDPKGNKLMISYRLEFECTNNIAKYEALFQGPKKEIDLGA